jgi:aspartyl/asparaginyl-tRNA synthetase
MGLGSDSTPVSVELFGQRTFLADSMQFQLEYLLRFSDTRGVFYTMPSFRGEDPDARHLNQFFHAEAEIRGTLDDARRLASRYVGHLAAHLAPLIDGELGWMVPDVGHIERLVARRGDFPAITFEAARSLLGQREDCFREHAGGVFSLTVAGEQRLLEEMGEPIWIIRAPAMSVPFYQALAEDGIHALSADLLLGIGETVGCGQRHQYGADVATALTRHGVDRNDYSWYVRMKEESPILTSGFGMGLERFLLWLLKHKDIRDIALFQRLKGAEPVP